MTSLSNRKKLLILPLAFVATSAMGFAGVTWASAQDSADHPKPPAWVESENYADFPDRVPVTGDKGVVGWSNKSELLSYMREPDPKSPAEAVERELARQKNPAVVPVYNDEGKQVDTFTMGRGLVSGQGTVENPGPHAPPE